MDSRSFRGYNNFDRYNYTSTAYDIDIERRRKEEEKRELEERRRKTGKRACTCKRYAE